jgi:regulatory protein
VNPPSNKSETRLIKLALNYLAIRSRSRSELVNYLKQKSRGQDQGIITNALAKVEDFNILNDSQFAREYASYLLNHGKGPLLIKYSLKYKGIDPSLIKQTVTDLDDEVVFQSASKQLAKISSSWHLDNPHLFKPKAFNYLTRRGFPPSIIDRVIDEYPSLTVK